MILAEALGKDPRPSIDYRKINEITKAELFPLPNIEERVEEVAAAKYITVLDLTKLTDTDDTSGPEIGHICDQLRYFYP